MKAAFYECDITPPLGCYSVGYGVERLAEDVYDRLYSKALVLEQSGSYAVIISVDMCEYPDDITDIVTGRILKYTGIAPESVCITATHTHYGAPVMDSPEINCFGDSCYKDVFCRLVADSAILAFKRLKPAKLHYGKASVDGVAYSRCHYMKDGSLKSFFPVSQPAERPLTEPDTELPALFVEHDGELAGVLYCFCCHQDTVSAKIRLLTAEIIRLRCLIF